MVKEKPVAVVTVRGATHMSRLEHKKIAKWLREQAKFVESKGGELSRRFTSRYIWQ